MKWKPTHGYRNIGITAFIVVAASMLFYFLLFRTSTLGVGLGKVIAVMNPIIYGYIIAYILNPVSTLTESTVFRLIYRMKLKKAPSRRAKKFIRVISVFFSVFLSGLVIYALISSVLPELLKSVRSIVFNFQRYVNNVNHFLDTTIFKDNAELDAKTTALITEYAGKIQEWFSAEMTPRLDNLVGGVTSGLFNFVTFLKNILLGVVISIYVLISKESMLARFRRFIYAVFPIPTGNRILFNLRFADEKFGGFVIGKIIDSAIIGVICYVCCRLFDFPYAMLISVVIGVTNVVPFFGPFIGAVPSTVLIFVVDPVKALIFIIFILCIQQFDGNLLGPKILGTSVGVSSYMVIIAILIGSGFFGFTGMIIAVPTFAVISAFVQSAILRRTKKHGLPGELEAYHYVDKVDPVTKDIVTKEVDGRARNLYDWIKNRDEIVYSYDEPIRENSWDRTIEQIEEEDASLSGIAVPPRKNRDGGTDGDVPDDAFRDDD